MPEPGREVPERALYPLNRERLSQTIARYGLAGPAPDADVESLVGLGDAWKETPVALARAYLSVEKEQHSVTQGRIVKA